MRSIIIYYSYSGNTKKVAQTLAEFLEGKGEVDLVELNAQDETTSFLGQCRRAVMRARAKLAPINFDLSDYDLVCFGTLVWAFAPTPAINTYFDNCKGLEGKPVCLFVTYGSGAGIGRCTTYMKRILLQKGVMGVKRFLIQQGKVKDKEFVLAKIKEIQPLSPNG